VTRMLPARYIGATKPLMIKRTVSSLRHISAPLKGLSLSSKLTTGDPLTATVLDNWVIEENQIRARAGTRLTYTYSDLSKPVEAMVPYYGEPNKLAAAIDGKLILLDGTLIEDGFASNDWSWTSFSNLSDTDYTVMVNGVDGVWSWDGLAMVKETVTAPTTDPWVVPEQFDIVVSHMNRLWFADKTNLSVYYLPLQQKSGAVKVLPLNAVFRRGGSIRAMYTWTTGDGGVNLDDRLVIFSTNGEAVIYGGTDPDSDFELTGIFRFDAPLSKRSVVNYGGELYVLISTGFVPMSTLMRAESEQLGKVDRNVYSLFFQCTLQHRNRPGYEAFLNPSSGRIICNMPQGGGVYKQLVRFMPNPIWATWSSLGSRCWGWVDNRLFFGTDNGRIFELHPRFLNDNGKPIRVDVQAAWANFGTPAAKHFKMVLPYLQTDGTPRPFVDVKVDYDMTEPTNQPDITYSAQGADWDLADWDTSDWAGSLRSRNNWTGVGEIGRVGAPRLTALISNCEFTLTGWDVLFESGSIFG
jgi:hypothetical protein